MRLALVLAALAAPALAQDISAVPLGANPAEDYQTAMEAFAQGDRQTAGCLFYRAQFRFRLRLGANPGLDPSGEPALFASLQEAVGRPINEWLGGDKEDWLRAIGCGVAFGRAGDDPLTPRKQFPEAWADALAGIEALRAQVEATSEADIRAQREAAGLPSR